MRTFMSLVALGLLPLSAVMAQEAADPGQRVAALRKQHSEAQSAAYAKLQAAQGDKEAQAAAMKELPQPAEWGKKFMALAEELKGTPEAIDCWLWVVQQDRQSTDKALAVLQADHLQSERLADVCQSLGKYTVAARAEEFLEACRKSEHAAVRGQASFALAGVLKGMADTSLRLKADPKIADRLRSSYGEAMVEKLKTFDTAAAGKRAEKLLEEVVQDYGDLKTRGNKTLAQGAEGELFELRNLSIGKKAPDIVGEDADGAAFKLSDYRGKVVLLDFYGDW
jgi:hypothetical protein